MELTFEGVRLERGGRTVLELDGLRIASGTTTAILGPNGSGKTSLLRAIAGLDTPAAGVIRVGGMTAHERQRTPERVAFAFQDLVFLQRPVRENLELALKLRGLGAKERAARIADLAVGCGIEPLLSRAAYELSGGEARRVNLARALGQRAPVTLLDEPMAGLDRLIRETLLYELPEMLAEFATTTLLVSHDRDEAFRIASDLVIIADGRLRAAGPKQAVFATPPDAASAAILGYTVVQTDGGEFAIAPASLRLADVAGGGSLVPGERFRAVVRSIAELATQREMLCDIAGVMVPVVLEPDAPVPEPGDVVEVISMQTVRLG